MNHAFPEPNDLTGYCGRCGVRARDVYDGTASEMCRGGTFASGAPNPWSPGTTIEQDLRAAVEALDYRVEDKVAPVRHADLEGIDEFFKKYPLTLIKPKAHYRFAGDRVYWPPGVAGWGPL